MADPIRAVHPPRPVDPQELARDYAELSRRLLAILQEERSDIAELRAAARQALDSSEECRRETAAMREEFRTAVGCIDTLRNSIEAVKQTSKEYIDELEAKMERYRRATKSMSEEAIAEAVEAKRVANTGRFDTADARAAAEDAMDERELAEAREKRKERAAATRAIVVSIVTAAILAMLGFLCIRLGLKP